MAFPSDITLINSGTFSTSVVRPTSVVRSDASKDITTPALLTISHETAKNGTENSVVISERLHSDEVNGTQKIRAMLKVTHNPTLGYALQEAELLSVIADLVEFFGVPANVDKFINKEA